MTNSFGPDLYGDPCRECGFDWSMAPGGASSVIERAPARFRSALAESGGDARPPGASWSVIAYVAHVADNIRIWAERLVAAAGASREVAAYDQDALARVRGYESMTLASVLWSLERAVGDWRAAWGDAVPAHDLGLRHPEMGALSLNDIVRMVAHDTTHHLMDVARDS
jgi:hypothetical protein